MSTCIDCTGTIYTPCSEVSCLSTNYGKCITYSGSPLYCATGGVGTLTFTGTAVAPLTTTEVTLTPTGGTGTGLQVKVTRTPGSVAYAVQIISVGSAYTVGDTITIVGASLGGATPANNLVLTVASLAALISNTTSVDDAIVNLHQRLCTITSVGLNYSGFNYSCLRLGGGLTGVGTAITTAQGFTESAASALCSLNTRVVAVETPTFTVPSCISGLTSASSTLGAILTAYGSKICTINTNVDMTGVLSNPCIAYPFSTKPTSTVVSDYLNWITSNMCGIYQSLATDISTVGTTTNSLKTYVAGGGSIPASINTSCITGGSTTSTLAAAAILWTSQICSINSTLTALATPNYALTWATNFGATVYYGYTFGYNNTSTTLQIQLDRIVATLGRMKMKLNASDFTATSDSDGLNVSLASGVRFTCSQLNSCSISSLSDVTSSAPSAYHSLFWNGSEYVNKELVFTSTGGTIAVTRANNPTNITINLETAAASVTTGQFTPNPPANISLIPSIRFPIGSYLQVHKQGSLVTFSGTVAATFSGSFSWANNQNFQFMNAPVGYVNLTPEYFQVTILAYTAASPSIPTAIYHGLGVLAGGGVLTFTMLNPAGTVNFVIGDSMEIIIGGFTYKV
jgi:hypothetical protein